MNGNCGRIVIMIFLTFFLMLLVTGCNKNNRNNENGKISFVGNTDIRYAERYQKVSLSEAGTIYDDRTEGRLYFTPIDSDETMIFCYDPNCRHIPATKNNPDSECMGALVYGNTNTMYYEGCIYFFVQDDAFSHKIYTMKTDGAGRKVMAEMPFGYAITNGCIFSEDKVYYQAKIFNVDEITNDIKTSNRIVEVDILDGTYRFITEENTDLLQQMDLAEGTLYIRAASAENGAIYVRTADVNTLEEKVIISSEKYATEYVCMDAFDKDSFFYWDRRTYDMGIRNVDGTVEKILVQGAEGETYGWPDASCDGLFYKRTIAYGDEPEGYYFLDLTTGKVTNLTDEQAKYGLFGYDGYYDAFVAHDGSYSNWTMWSKEKVLGEAKE